MRKTRTLTARAFKRYVNEEMFGVEKTYAVFLSFRAQ